MFEKACDGRPVELNVAWMHRRDPALITTNRKFHIYSCMR